MFLARVTGHVVANDATGLEVRSEALTYHRESGVAQSEVAMAKIQVADTLHKAVDTAIQLCGARGYSKDTVLEWIYRYARQARLVDGASEVHKMLLARSYLAQGSEFWSWG